MTDAKPGYDYRHFKGGTYTVRGTGMILIGENKDPAVFYAPTHAPLDMYARTLVDWAQPVTWPDGIIRSRFVRRSDIESESKSNGSYIEENEAE